MADEKKKISSYDFITAAADDDYTLGNQYSPTDPRTKKFKMSTIWAYITTKVFSWLSVEEQTSTPSTPAAGTQLIYPKDDGAWYTLNDTGSESALGATVKLDDLQSPDDNTDLNVSTSAHGLMPKLPNLAAQFINGQGSWKTLQAAVNLIIGDGSNAITSGVKAYLAIPDDLEIVSATLLADASGSIVIDIKKAAYADWPTSTSIVASAKPTLSSAQKSQDSTLTGWTKNLTAGDILEVVVDSATTVKQVTLALICKRQ